MSSCPNCYQNNSPETPDITINQTTLQWDTDEVRWYDEYFLGTDVVAGTLTLAHTPVGNEAVQLYLNSGAQGEDTVGVQSNFSVVDTVITLNWTPAATDAIHVHYLGVV